jgi:hypothetical protein
MSQVNWGRLVIGGVIASIIAFVTDGILHEHLIHHHWEALVEGLHITPSGHSPLAFVYFAIFELGRGFVSLFLYVMMRARFGPGPGTAAWAGVVGWVAFSVTGPAQFIPLGFYSNTLWCLAGAYQLVISVVATIAGAAAYTEKA